MSSSIESIAAPPSASGDAGGHLEARVGAYYVLSMLAEGQPRGLPGSVAHEVALQQRAVGHPLDDIVVHAKSADGSPATLEIQVKRSVDFIPSDKEFADIARQLWLASQKPEFKSQRYELGIAIAKSSTRIDRDVQETLRWARKYLDADSFFAALTRESYASNGMRAFVSALEGHLRSAGGNSDHQTVWSILRRLNVMVFDFESPGSDYENRAHEQATAILHPDIRYRAGDLWNALIADVEETMSAAGARDRATIMENLSHAGGYRFDAPPSLRTFFANLMDHAELASRDMTDEIGGARLARVDMTNAALDGLEKGRIVNITGMGGVGKSAVMLHVIERVRSDAIPIVVSNTRIIAGGWPSMAHVLGATAPSKSVFDAIDAAGGAVLFVDNIDQIEGASEQATLRDLLRAVAQYPTWRAVVTTNIGSAEWRSQLPRELTNSVVSVEVSEISDADAMELAHQNRRLAAVLAPNHPARKIARNLFFLRRIAEMGSASAGGISTEMDLARIWWRYGGGRSEDKGRFGRLRVLRQMASDIWSRPEVAALRSDNLDSEVLAELVQWDTVREVRIGADVTFGHDVLRDWAIGFLILEQPERLRDAVKTHPLSVTLSRALEITTRLALSEGPSGGKWRDLLAATDGTAVHGSWRRPILLAAARGEDAMADLDALRGVLVENEGSLLREFLRQFLVSDTIPASEWLKRLKPDVDIPRSGTDLAVPSGKAWFPVVQWLVDGATRLPPQAVPEATRIFLSWLLAMGQMPLPINADIVGIVFGWLEIIDEETRPRAFRRDEAVPPPSGIPNLKDTGEVLRLTAFTFAQANKLAAQKYLQAVNAQAIRHGTFETFITSRANLARAAPEEFADFVLKALEPDPDDRNERRYGPFMMHEGRFMPASPAQGPFFEILEVDAASGLKLVRGIVRIATEWMVENPPLTVVVPFPDGARRFLGGASVFMMGRAGVPSSITACALLALEAWAHGQIEGGRDAASVLADVWGPDGSSAALLAVSIDVIISHWVACRDIAWPLFASPRLLLLDNDRAVRDQTGAFGHTLFGVESGGPVKLADLQARPSRGVSLTRLPIYYTFSAPGEVKSALLAALDAAVAEAEKVQAADDDPLHGIVALAKRTRRMMDSENWQDGEATLPDGRTAETKEFIPEERERLLYDESMRKVQARTQRTERIAWLHLAFDDPARSTPEHIRASVEWAKAETVSPAADDGEGKTEAEMASRAVVTAAALVARDYRENDREALLHWACPVLQARASLPPKTEGYETDQIAYNEAAIATVGLLALAGPDVPLPERAQALLPLASASGAAAANAIGAVLKSWPDDDPMTRALLRVLMVKSTYVWTRFGDANKSKRQKAHARWIAEVAERELRWLEGKGDEPSWPTLPPWLNRPRRKRRITREGIAEVPQGVRPDADMLVDQGRLAKVLHNVFPLMIGKIPPWIVPMMDHLLAWTIPANAGEEDENPERRPSEWNGEFFQDIGFLIAGMDQGQAIARFVTPILGLGDDAFHEAAASLIRGFDIAVFSSDSLKPADQAAVRRAVANRIRKTWNYARGERQKSMNTEIGAGGLYTAMFFAPPGFMPNRSVHMNKDWAELETVMPVLTELVTGAPASGYLAILFLDVLSAAPRPSLLPSAIAAGHAWSQAYGTDEGFWVHNDIGARLCGWLAEQLDKGLDALREPDLQALTASVDVMMAAGVTSARRIEEILVGRGARAAAADTP